MKKKHSGTKQTSLNFSNIYPNIAYWIESQGWIELGKDHYSNSWVRCLDTGGNIWESNKKHKTLDQALKALELFLEKEIDDYV